MSGSEASFERPVHITVDDPERALAFYRDALGYEVTNDVENEGFHWITLTSEAQPGVNLVLSQPEPGRSEEDARALSELLAKGGLYARYWNRQSGGFIGVDDETEQDAAE